MLKTQSAMGRVAVVTGSNKGIGLYIAMHLATSGAFEHLILACRNTTRAEAAVQYVRSMLIEPSVSIRAESLLIGEKASHLAFVSKIEQEFGKIDCFVNNAGFAFKNADPTPFKKQTKPTMDINFHGTLDITESILPLLRKGKDPRLVSVASMSGRLSQLSPGLQKKFSAKDLSMPKLMQLVKDFESAVQDETHLQKGYSNSNYGMSKLALVAATRVLARDNPGIAINCCCPGYCKTDMTSHGGTRNPSEGAMNAVIPATMENPPTGVYFADYKPSRW